MMLISPEVHLMPLAVSPLPTPFRSGLFSLKSIWSPKYDGGVCLVLWARYPDAAGSFLLKDHYFFPFQLR